jgi:hypothetical protein
MQIVVGGIRSEKMSRQAHKAPSAIFVLILSPNTQVVAQK